MGWFTLTIKFLIGFFIVSAILAFFYPTLKPSIEKLSMSIKDPVQKGFINMFGKFLDLCYLLWFNILKGIGALQGSEIMLIRRILNISNGSVTITKHCTCICS